MRSPLIFQRVAGAFKARLASASIESLFGAQMLRKDRQY